MKYYADTEFNQQGGELMSVGIVREDGRALYMTFRTMDEPKPWIKENVIPHLYSSPIAGFQYEPFRTEEYQNFYHAQKYLALYFAEDNDVEIIVDWPVDVAYLSQMFLLNPGTMIDVQKLKFTVERVDTYPTEIPGAVQHNAMWDALALRLKLTGQSGYYDFRETMNQE